MNNPLTGRDILKAVEEVCASKEDAYLAVAYWSGGIAKHIQAFSRAKIHVVLDISAGGTSPEDLQFLMEWLEERVRVHPDLHSKVFASPQIAVLGSANATRPGLQIIETARVEAAVKVTGDAAIEIYEFARKLYDTSEPATKEHLRICKERFGRATLSQTEFGKVESLDLITALIRQPDLYGHLPLIVTAQDVDDDLRNAAWEEQQMKLAPGVESAFDLSQWDSFNWNLSAHYDDKICLALHVGKNQAVYAGLVRPVPFKGHDWTFARRVNWSEIPGLQYKGQMAKRLPKGNNRDDLRRAMFALIDQDDEALWVSDLVFALSHLQ